MNSKKMYCLLMVSLALVVSCTKKTAGIDRWEIERTLDYLRYYTAFEIEIVEMDEREGLVVLSRPFLKGRLIPIPGISGWTPEPNKWLYATEEIERYFDKVAEIIGREKGVKEVKWQHIGDSDDELFFFRNPYYTACCLLASLAYGDSLTFRLCFAKQLLDDYKQKGIDLYEELGQKYRFTGMLPNPFDVGSESKMGVLITRDSSVILLLDMTREEEQWRILSFEEVPREQVLKE